MISKIKENLDKVIGKELHFKYNGARNQIEEYDGYIEKTYNYIFTISSYFLENCKTNIFSYHKNSCLLDKKDIFVLYTISIFINI